MPTLIKVGRLVERRMNRALQAHGITAAHYLALIHIGQNPRSSRAALSRGLLVSPQAAGGVVDRLLSAGLISRGFAADGRIELTLTPSGADLLQDVRPVIDEANLDVVRILKPGHESFLDSVLRYILAKLGECRART
ncbi:MAG TPA: MarR family transcriptional regulator [Pseudonocardia sp.]|jgi:DNA-binding MarR family transcriptional regulator|nr:MarR family transcriptional regulator [Pseudonocardia sp.]